jgi:hypothetical protein
MVTHRPTVKNAQARTRFEPHGQGDRGWTMPVFWSRCRCDGARAARRLVASRSPDHRDGDSLWSGMRYWMSFCDNAKPKGEQFLGTCIVHAHDEVEATRLAWARGMNPGAEIMFMVIDEHVVGRAVRGHHVQRNQFGSLRQRWASPSADGGSGHRTHVSPPVPWAIVVPDPWFLGAPVNLA